MLLRAPDLLRQGRGLEHLDSINANVKLAKDSANFLEDKTKELLSANAYLGARAIALGLRKGADIIICEYFESYLTGSKITRLALGGRVADASP